MARESCPDDRRGAFAALTATGQEVMDRAIPGHIAHVDEVLQSLLTPEEEATLSSLLRKIRDQLYDPEGACEAALGELDPLDCPSAG